MMNLTDFHSHILPGVDDGSDSVERSLEMLRMEYQQGIRHVIATPHFYANHDRPERFLARRAEAFARLQTALAQEPELPGITLGAEVYAFPGMSDSEVLPQLTVAGTDLLLVEMPMPVWHDALYRELEGIRVKQGLTPVIAHIDRYIRPLQTHGILRRLGELPVLIQANAEFFINPRTRSFALRLLRQGRIHLLGSDCHDTTDRRPNLAEAVDTIRRHGAENALAALCENQSELLTVR